MSLEWPDERERRAIAEHEFRDYTSDDLHEWAVQERAADFETWPTILHGYIEALAEEQAIAYDDAMALAIHTPEGVDAMRAWALARRSADARSASPTGIVAVVEREYPGGLAGWRSHSITSRQDTPAADRAPESG